MGLLALLLCLVFIASLLVRDVRRRKHVSGALWVPTLMAMCLGSRSPSGWLAAFAGAGSPNVFGTGNLTDQAFYLLTIGASLIIASRRGVRWNKLFAANAALTIFYIYFFLSPLWSAYPGDSLIRVLKDFGATVIVISAILSEKNPLEAVRAVFVRCAYVLIPLSALFSRFSYGGFGRAYGKGGEVMIVGVADYKNSLGEMTMILSLFLIWDYVEGRPANAKWLWSGMRFDVVALLVMGLYLLNVSESKTSLVVFLMGLGLTYGGGWFASRPFQRIVFLIALSFPLLIIADRSSTSIVTPVLEALGRDATFTGRTDIWKHITLKTVNPLLGAGFYTFWGRAGGDAIREAMDTGVPNAHNGYLDTYLDGGIVGVVFLFGFLIAAGTRLLRHLDVNRFQRVKFAFLIIAIIGGVTESNFARPSLFWFATVLAVIDFPSLRAHEELSHELPALDKGVVVEVGAEGYGWAGDRER